MLLALLAKPDDTNYDALALAPTIGWLLLACAICAVVMFTMHGDKSSPLAKKDPPLLAKSRPPKSNPSRRPRPATPPSLGGRPEPRRPCGRCPASARAGSAADGSSRTHAPVIVSACAASPTASENATDARARSGGARTQPTRRPSDCADVCESPSRGHPRPRSWPDYGSTWCET